MFIAHLQKSGGCDYTIGCGHKVESLKATTKTEAIEELKLIVVGEYLPEHNCFEEGYRGEQELSSVTLYEVSSVEKLPINVWYQEADNLVASGRQRAKENAEQKEYERLRAKFEK